MNRALVTPLPADHSQPIPDRVYWAPLADNFYSDDGPGMGNDFYAKWYSRRAEFPKGEAWGFGPGSQHNPFKDAPRNAGVRGPVPAQDLKTGGSQ